MHSSGNETCIRSAFSMLLTMPSPSSIRTRSYVAGGVRINSARDSFSLPVWQDGYTGHRQTQNNTIYLRFRKGFESLRR